MQERDMSDTSDPYEFQQSDHEDDSANTYTELQPVGNNKSCTGSEQIFHASTPVRGQGELAIGINLEVSPIVNRARRRLSEDSQRDDVTPSSQLDCLQLSLSMCTNNSATGGSCSTSVR